MIEEESNKRIEEFNKRIRDNQFPDIDLEPNFGLQKTSTRYERFPIFEKSVINKPINYPAHNLSVASFTPPCGKNGPFSGFNVMDESRLQNRFFPLQKSDHTVYVPSSNSDLYKNTVISSPSNQPFPLLFEKQIFYNYPHQNLMNVKIGKDKWNNNTRIQLRDE
jgi:hypothetical protein